MDNDKGTVTVKQKLHKLWQDEWTLKTRLLLTALCAFAFSFTFIIFGPCEIFIQNISDFTFGFFDMFLPMLFLGIIVFGILTGGLILLHGKIFNYALNILFTVTLAGYLQGFINVDHGSFTGDSVKWFYFKLPMFVDCLFWIFVLLCSIGCMYCSYKVWQSGVRFISFVIICVQAVALMSLMTGTNLTVNTDNMYLSADDVYEVAYKDNVIIFLLDRLDNRFTDEVLELHPEWKEELSGFTYYHNFTGSYANTRPSITYLFTGVENDYTVPWQDYFDKVWSEPQMPMLADIHDAGYKTGVYTEGDYVLGNAKNYADIIDNVTSAKMLIDHKEMLKQMLYLSAYRYMPEAMKPYFVADTNKLAKIVSVAPDVESTVYVEDDPAFWDGYRENGLSVNTEIEGRFLFYHLNGAHPPYTMNEDAEHISGDEAGDRNAQITGNMNMIFRYIDELKEKGLYEQTTVIITTDHARPPKQEGVVDDVMDSRVLTLMIKPAGADLAVPMQTSNKQVCQDNLRASIVDYFGLDTAEYGRTVESVGEDEEIVRYVWMRGEIGSVSDQMYTFKIIGDANDFANWELISTDVMKEPSL